jgi:hypothetical protein
MFRSEVLRPGAALASHVDLADVVRRFERHAAGARDESYALWSVWVLERWLAGRAAARPSQTAVI